MDQLKVVRVYIPLIYQVCPSISSKPNPSKTNYGGNLHFPYTHTPRNLPRTKSYFELLKLHFGIKGGREGRNTHGSCLK